MLRASVIAEAAGVRSVSIVMRGFVGQAKAVAEAAGVADIGIAEYPGMVTTDGDQAFREKVAGPVVDGILTGLASELHRAVRPSASDPTKVVFSGTLDEVQEHFGERLWSDGLPIIPPTRERVHAFLRYTGRPHHQVLGTLAPESRPATVWNVAVNGVMAGCRPEYMPLLIAAVEAIADSEFRIEDAGSTPGWEPIVIVSGPLARELDVACGAGLARVGRQANSSIGRFLRLYMRNVAGLRTPPGHTDKASIGMNFNVAIAENEDAVVSLGWKTFGEDRGYSRDDNVVTVQSVVAASGPIYSAGTDASHHLDVLATVFGGGTCAYWSYTATKFGKSHPLLILSPAVARVLAAAGHTKDTIRQYLHEHATIELSLLKQYSLEASGNELDLDERVRSGVAPAAFSNSDPRARVPIFPWAGGIGVLVAGDPDRNQSKGLCNNHVQGPPISKLVELPPQWRELRSSARQSPTGDTDPVCSVE